MYQHFIEGLQRLGRALMLPIAISRSPACCCAWATPTCSISR